MNDTNFKSFLPQPLASCVGAATWICDALNCGSHITAMGQYWQIYASLVRVVKREDKKSLVLLVITEQPERL